MDLRPVGFGVFICLISLSWGAFSEARQPQVVNTWPFLPATRTAWDVLALGGSAVDAVIAGCSTCERLQCDGTVGFGGSPDEDGQTTLDAMIMDGTTMDVGAVGALRDVKDAIRAAHLVSRHSEHTLLVGDAASRFAIAMGLQETSLATDASRAMHAAWRNASCQPNFWRRVTPDSRSACGPYRPDVDSLSDAWAGQRSHDTIAMLAVDGRGNIAAGTSTNGASHKIPGRVGDASIPGAGAYAVTGVGACGATGDGDFMMRFLPCYQVVESMRLGKTPTEATEDAMRRILQFTLHRPFQGALVALDGRGNHGAAAAGWTFQYAVRTGGPPDDVQVITVQPMPIIPQRPSTPLRTLPTTSKSPHDISEPFRNIG